MKKVVPFFLLTLACVAFLEIPKARTAANNEAEIRKVLDQWAKAFHARDLNGIMSIYEPGDALVSYDIVPPLQYSGYEAYKKDYQEFLDQFQGPVEIEYRDLKIVAGDTVAFSRGLERMTGTLKNGQKFDTWVRFTECYRKTNGRWLATNPKGKLQIWDTRTWTLANLSPPGGEYIWWMGFSAAPSPPANLAASGANGSLRAGPIRLC